MCLCVRFILHYSIVLLTLYYSIALSEQLRYVYGFAPYIYHFDWLIDSCPRLGFAGEGTSRVHGQRFFLLLLLFLLLLFFFSSSF